MPQYKVLKPFCHKGKVQKKGETLTLHEREARYLVIGSDPWVAPIEEAAEKPKTWTAKAKDDTGADTAAPKAPKNKKSDEPVAEGGEVNG